MAPLFDDSTWRQLSYAAQQYANIITHVQPQLDILNSPAVQQQIDLMQSVGPALQQYIDQTSTLASSLVQRYIERLQTELMQEPAHREVLEDPEIALEEPSTRERILTFSPSLLLLEDLRAQRISLNDLTWRQFEEIIAELLNKHGYTVELGRGSKDDGKDIVAVKYMPGVGLFLSIWQAKKLERHNKVGLDVIRVLADTTRESKANKGIIVTTTSLTRGALKRIEQDRYLLGKMDGDDLLTWIQQTQ